MQGPGAWVGWRVPAPTAGVTAALAALCAGTWFGFYEVVPVPYLLAAAFVGAFLTSIRRRAAARLLGLVVLTGACGVLAGNARRPEESAVARVAASIPSCSFRGHVIEDAGALGTFVALPELHCAALRATVGGVVVVDRVRWPAGTRISGEGWVLPLGSDGFDRARARLGAQAALSPTRVEEGDIEPWHLSAAASVRSALYEAAASLERRARALLLGLALGETGDFDPVTLERFRRAGLSHLLAVSGSNVAIVLGVVALAVRNLWLAARVACAGAALVFFVLVVGPDASVLRATAMGAVAVAALASGRTAEPLHGLAVALVALIALRPSLLFSVGLHLSAAATAGIIVWARPIERRLFFLPRPIRLITAATLAAQCAVAPLLIAVFGEVSIASPIANVAAFIAVAPATILSLLAAVVGLVHPGTAEVLLRVAEPCARWILFVADRLGEPEWSSVSLPGWCGWAAAALTLVAASWAVAARFEPGALEHLGHA